VEGVGHEAQGTGQGAWGMGQGAWGREHGACFASHSPESSGRRLGAWSTERRVVVICFASFIVIGPSVE